VLVGQMSDHRWCLGIRVCGAKISCPPWQLNGGCADTAPDSNLIGLHLPPTATGRPSAKRDTRRGSRAIGRSTNNNVYGAVVLA